MKQNTILTSGFRLFVSKLIMRQIPLRLYFAVGEGKKDWDEYGLPTLSDAKSLIKEVYRQEVDVSSIIYVDKKTHKESDVPTDCLKITVILSNNNDYVGTDLREFGLYDNDNNLILYGNNDKISLRNDSSYIRYIYINT